MKTPQVKEIFPFGSAYLLSGILYVHTSSWKYVLYLLRVDVIYIVRIQTAKLPTFINLYVYIYIYIQTSYDVGESGYIHYTYLGTFWSINVSWCAITSLGFQPSLTTSAQNVICDWSVALHWQTSEWTLLTHECMDALLTVLSLCSLMIFNLEKYDSCLGGKVQFLPELPSKIGFWIHLRAKNWPCSCTILFCWLVQLFIEF